MLPDIEAHYADLIERSLDIGELCMTWCRAASADEVLGAFDVDVLDVTMSGLHHLVKQSYDDLEAGRLGRFLMLAEEPPWFLAMEYTGDRAFRALERLSSGGEALCLIGSQMLYRGRLYYAREGRRLCMFDYGGDIWGDTAPIAKHLGGLFNLHERYADVERGLVPGDETLDDWRIHAFVLMERITGIRLSFELLERGNALYRFRG
ncbi:DUF6461 domain-containing protein [Microbispora bryophytorum]|uniref:Uncharacterized protein n=1 Tax=Microbispora bryophytorum subsp. camponoti TaxID=1677852 RepID=A0ABR8L541_9ACTN|nr:DUF6461 domain-containing protein [Microbispora camponoti]MBD3144859.1 hypothetical protein [Microbispora camponoti]